MFMIFIPGIPSQAERRAEEAEGDGSQGCRQGASGWRGYQEIWQEMRRTSLHTLKTFGLGKSFLENIIEEEINDLFEYIDNHHLNQPINVRRYSLHFLYSYGHSLTFRY